MDEGKPSPPGDRAGVPNFHGWMVLQKEDFIVFKCFYFPKETILYFISVHTGMCSAFVMWPVNLAFVQEIHF